MSEVWKPIPGHEHYEASSAGRVRSLDHTGQRLNRWGKVIPFRWKGRVLKPISHRGYLVVKLGGANNVQGVHQLVALAFHGVPAAGMVVDHLNGVKTDNRPENLEFVTSSENVNRAYRTGLLCNTGQRNGNAKLTDAQVAQVRSDAESEGVPKTAKKYGLSSTHVRRLARRLQRADAN